MKKFFPALASMMLLASCAGAPATTSHATGLSTPEETTSQETTSAAEYVLTFLENGELYIDFNFTTAPEGLSIKIGDNVVTASGKVKMTKDFAYEVKGTFAEKVNVYYVADLGGAASAGKSEGRDGDTVTDYLNKMLKNFSERQYEYRLYLCLSDKANGWSTTLPGVDETIKKYAPTPVIG